MATRRWSGPVPGSATRPREWPVYRGYGALAANTGMAAAISDLDYTDARALDAPIAQLERLVDAARAEPCVDSNRVVVWAFSGGARLVGSWLEDPPAWMKGLALTYPVVPTVSRVAGPVVVTRVGLEQPHIQAALDQFLALTPTSLVIDVPNGQHGFDLLDHNDESRRAVCRMLDAVIDLCGAAAFD